MKITEYEMRGLLAGKCLPGDMRLNEELPSYLVRKFDELQQKLDSESLEKDYNADQIIYWKEQAGLLKQKLEATERACAAFRNQESKMQQKLDALAAENASMMALAIACEKEFGSYTSEEFPDDAKVSYPEDKCHITFGMIRGALNKSATDAYLNSVRAEGVELFSKHCFDKKAIRFWDNAGDEARIFAAQVRSGTHDTADKAGAK